MTPSLAIMQPYFFPYIGYFQLIHSVDSFLPYDRLDYIKNGWINRNRILAYKGKPFYITAPLSRESKSSYRKISDVKITSNVTWRSKLIYNLEVQYSKRPYFASIFPVLNEIIAMNISSLSDMNVQAIIRICKLLEINTDIISDTKSYSDIEEKLDQLNSRDTERDFDERKSIRAVEICKKLNSSVLVNAIGGVDLYNKEYFSKNEIQLLFIKTANIRYVQGTTDFFKDLSIIDVLMNCGWDGTRRLLDEYELI